MNKLKIVHLLRKLVILFSFFTKKTLNFSIKIQIKIIKNKQDFKSSISNQ